MSHSSPTCILQDDIGFLWIGTFDGLNRYNGAEFKIINIDPSNKGTLTEHYVTALCLDGSGSLWVGTREGLNRLDRDTEQITHYYHQEDDPRSIPGNFITALARDNAGNLWIGTTQGLCVRESGSDGFRTVPLTLTDGRKVLNPHIYAITVHTNGSLWIGLHNLQLLRLVPEDNTFERYMIPLGGKTVMSSEAYAYTFALCEDAAGNLIAAADRNGVYTLDIGTRSFAPFQEEVNDFLQENRYAVVSLLQDSNGDIWLGLSDESGIIRIRNGSSHYERYLSSSYYENSIGSNTILTLYEDRSGLIWIGSRAGGMTKVRRLKFPRLKANPFEAFRLSSRSVRSVFEDSDGILWVGYLDGIDRVDLNERTVRKISTTSDGRETLQLRSIYYLGEIDRDHLLIGSLHSGLLKYNKRTGRHTRYPELATALSVASDNDNNLWIAAGFNGVYRYNPHTGELERYFENDDPGKNFAGSFTVSLKKGTDGRIYIATERGFHVIDPVINTAEFYGGNANDPGGLRTSNIYCVHTSADGSVWLGTFRGLSRFDPNTKTFRTYTSADGLNSDTINSILEDPAGRLWLATNDGISRFSPETGEVINYSVDDGLQDKEFNLGAACVTSAGELVFGGIEGLNIFDPMEVKNSTYVTPLIIRSVRFFEGENKWSLQPPYSKEIVETYAREIRFQYIALDYTNPDKIIYYLKFVTQGPDWFTSDYEDLYLTQLKPGEYTFHVKSTNSDGVLCDNEQTYTWRILPFYWETTWFKTLTIILGLVVTAGLVLLSTWLINKGIKRQRDKLKSLVDERTRELRQSRDKLEQQTRQLAMRNRQLESFSFSVSQDLRVPLRYIKGYIEILLDSCGTKMEPAAIGYMQRINEAAVKIDTLSEDLLWLSRASSLDIQNVSVNLGQMAEEVMAELKRRHPNRNVKLVMKEKLVAAGDIRLLRVVMENLLENAWNFTILKEEGVIEMGVLHEEAGDVFYVRDNGIGFNSDDAEKMFMPFEKLHAEQFESGIGIGLTTVQQIIERHGGQVWADGEPGSHSIFYFTLSSTSAE